MMEEGAKYIDKGNDWKLLALSLIATILEKTKYHEISSIWPNLITLFVHQKYVNLWLRFDS